MAAGARAGQGRTVVTKVAGTQQNVCHLLVFIGIRREPGSVEAGKSISPSTVLRR
jgi:hypothetical protein